jgi:DNA-binding transcriptional LysR family regulator
LRVDLDAVRTFVAAADAGQFQEAAAALSITQQAASKRIAALEKDLGVRLFTRTPRGVRLTIDGQAFLPHARELVRVAERADASVRPGRRALRVDVHSRRIAPAVVLQDFYRAHPGVELDVVTLDADAAGAIAAVEAGTIDATFHAVTFPARRLPALIKAARVIDEPHELLVGPRHALANARAVTPAQLAGHRIWMPGMAAGTEWADYYDELAAAFGLTIDVVGPVFGNEALLAEIADSAELATLVGERSRYLWPDSYDLRRIPVRDPSPVYPMSLIWRADNRHPALGTLRAYLGSRKADAAGTDVWTPSWRSRSPRASSGAAGVGTIRS